MTLIHCKIKKNRNRKLTFNLSTHSAGPCFFCSITHVSINTKNTQSVEFDFVDSLFFFRLVCRARLTLLILARWTFSNQLIRVDQASQCFICDSRKSAWPITLLRAASFFIVLLLVFIRRLYSLPCCYCCCFFFVCALFSRFFLYAFVMCFRLCRMCFTFYFGFILKNWLCEWKCVSMCLCASCICVFVCMGVCVYLFNSFQCIDPFCRPNQYRWLFQRFLIHFRVSMLCVCV